MGQQGAVGGVKADQQGCVKACSINAFLEMTLIGCRGWLVRDRSEYRMRHWELLSTKDSQGVDQVVLSLVWRGPAEGEQEPGLGARRQI